MHWIQKILFYMNGRYGYDEFSKVLLITGLLFGVAANFVGGTGVSALGLALIAFGGLRVLSKEQTNRRRELQAYLRIKHKLQHVYRRTRNRWIQRKAFKILKCPECHQKIRVPRGRKIRITCPSCRHSFVEKT
ncbi:hypothetical protein ADIAL_1055 [Alkalibacterium sp. AK22]|uniref:hypothetical protein n=1 Tax=Alkalibacterium sp. AK22 TaxID=1229520 RepID=UPI00044D3803|nr:hypothetical protein [Alkalibacterium sp. AK22]EXJ23443.1 hypothetical protein ADIAL_1055 [Alkalibacterium sp. AK22]